MSACWNKKAGRASNAASRSPYFLVLRPELFILRKFSLLKKILTVWQPQQRSLTTEGMTTSVRHFGALTDKDSMRFLRDKEVTPFCVIEKSAGSSGQLAPPIGQTLSV